MSHYGANRPWRISAVHSFQSCQERRLSFLRQNSNKSISNLTEALASPPEGWTRRILKDVCVYCPFQKKLILDNHNLSVDTNAHRCTTLIMVFATDQRRIRRCLAPKRSSCHGTGCCSQPLPSEHRCVCPLKVLLSCYWAFSGFMAVIFQGEVVR